MRMMMLILVTITMAACTVSGGEGAAVQQVAAGPVATVTVRAPGQLAVSWSADQAAAQYHVFRSSGQNFVDIATMFGPAPGTSYIDSGLTGAEYCYAIQSQYLDGSTSAIGAAGCGTSTGSGGGSGTVTRSISGLTVVPEWPGQAGGAGAARVASTWTFASQNWMYFPAPTNPGETLVGYQVYVFKGSSSAFAIASNLIEVDSATGQQSIVAGATNQDAAPGRITIGTQGLSRVVAVGKSYLIRIADGSGSGASNADSFTDAALFLR